MLETKYIPKLGRSITRLGLGTLPMGPLQRKLTPEEGSEVVRAAVANGITFIDTAAIYGTYEHIARGLRGFNGTVTIATKTHAQKDRSMAQEHLEKALKGLVETESISCSAIARVTLSQRNCGVQLWKRLFLRAKMGPSGWSA